MWIVPVLGPQDGELQQGGAVASQAWRKNEKESDLGGATHCRRGWKRENFCTLNFLQV